MVDERNQLIPESIDYIIEILEFLKSLHTKEYMNICDIYIYIYMNIYPSLEIDRSEKAMAPHSSTLAWKIPWMEEPGGLHSMMSLRVRHD